MSVINIFFAKQEKYILKNKPLLIFVHFFKPFKK